MLIYYFKGREGSLASEGKVSPHRWSARDTSLLKASVASESVLLSRHSRRKGADGSIFTLSHQPVQITLKKYKVRAEHTPHCGRNSNNQKMFLILEKLFSILLA